MLEQFASQFASCKLSWGLAHTIPSVHFGSAAGKWRFLGCGMQQSVQTHSTLLPRKSAELPGYLRLVVQKTCWWIQLVVATHHLHGFAVGVPYKDTPLYQVVVGHAMRPLRFSWLPQYFFGPVIFLCRCWLGKDRTWSNATPGHRSFHFPWVRVVALPNHRWSALAPRSLVLRSHPYGKESWHDFGRLYTNPSHPEVDMTWWWVLRSSCVFVTVGYQCIDLRSHSPWKSQRKVSARKKSLLSISICTTV